MKLTKKNLLITGILIMIICIGCVVVLKPSAAPKKNIENNDLTKVVELQKNAITLKNELGSNTPYPRLYLMAESLVEIKGIDRDKAIAQSTAQYVEIRALVWYAEKSGISFTELEFEQHLNSLIEDAKRADDYDALNNAYESVNSSLEENYRENSGFYREDYMMSKLYNHWSSNYTPSEMESVDTAWENLILEVTANYKESQSYKELRPALTESIKIYSSGAKENIKELKASEIFTASDKNQKTEKPS